MNPRHISQAFQSVLEQITDFMHWPVGHAYVPDADAPWTFIDSDVWSLPEGAEFQSLRNVTGRVRFESNVGTIGGVVASGRPVWIADVTRDNSFVRAREWAPLGIKASLAFPVLIGRETVAVLEFFAREAVEPDDELLEVMIHVGTQLGRVVERRRLQEQLVDAVWRQQRILGQELHDGVGQELTGIGMMSSALAQKLRSQGVTDADKATELTEYIRQALARVRALSRGLFPVEVDADGLMAALTLAGQGDPRSFAVESVDRGRPATWIDARHAVRPAIY